MPSRSPSFSFARKGSINQVVASQDLQDFRGMARERESVIQMICIQKVEMKRLLQTTFPELERLCAIDTKVMLDFIGVSFCPSGQSGKAKDDSEDAEEEGSRHQTDLHGRRHHRAARSFWHNWSTPSAPRVSQRVWP